VIGWRIAALTLPVAVAACGGDRAPAKDSTATAKTSASSAVDLTGAGATFPYPIYAKWIADYATKTGVRINYQSIGSGGGIRQLSEMTVDFGGSDSPMSDEELVGAKGGPILHIPTVMGADVVVYNLPGVTAALKLTPDVIADIFLGKITKWNDARIAAPNAGITLPPQDILVVHRSDGSGTTFIWTDYLSAVSPAWAKGPGKGKDVKWPVGLGARGNEGVSGQVKQTPGSIGYAELIYAKQNKLAYASVRNSSGAFVEPTLESVAAAGAAAMEKLPPTTDYRVSIVNASGKDAYPIASLTWILLYKNQRDAVKGRKLLDFLTWALTEGGATARALSYVPLTQPLVAQLKDRLATVQLGPAK
jgi:phosphate transport system substrate-binding protein